MSETKPEPTIGDYKRREIEWEWPSLPAAVRTKIIDAAFEYAELWAWIAEARRLLRVQQDLIDSFKMSAEKAEARVKELERDKELWKTRLVNEVKSNEYAIELLRNAHYPYPSADWADLVEKYLEERSNG